MRAQLTPEPSLSFSSIRINSRNPNPSRIPTSLHFLKKNGGHRLLGRKPRLIATRAVLDSATTEQLGLNESDIRNPAISSTYRNSKLPKPNQTVLEAQARVCTGPTQTRPLSEEQAFKVLDTILRSVRGELKDEEQVSKAQLGAFFAGMTIRANAFPEATQWSEGERCAMKKFWPQLVRVLPPDVIFIADPEGSIMGFGSAAGPHFVGNGTSEMRLVGALREILAGGHLGYEEVQGVLKDSFALKLEDGNSTGVSESLLSAFLIGQRMNKETDRELKAYCLAFDDELGPAPVADVRSLTHYGEPYDGNTRYFRSTLFVSAVRSCYGESSLLHGVEWMPPKGGVTEEQMLKFMGANTNLSLHQAKELIEDNKVGFAYISLREARPSLYSLIGLREQIKKRPPLATTEKVQQFITAKGRESIVAGFYHEGYEEPLLMLMKRRGVHSGLVIKGEEACEVDGVSLQSFRLEVNAMDYGFEPTDTPRTDRSVSKNIELGLAALRGEKGPTYDRIVLNAGIVDHLLGCDGAEDVSLALERAKEAIDSDPLAARWRPFLPVTQFLPLGAFE
ncbi:hypothetical protein like AT1G70570 [Hibiscus trionum]|uniref:Anthranilate phosphoribosyltransferase n=1 Tax=Hibiscus trionum TaxID=183268 RepID=A0A9W7HDR4_HIBTR|nr:hypothetical protein like AT1G70570 [Hibiscus trionum]